ncbi:MAG: 16S rRNA (uracil(1498)-N(3))-methyltransferase [Desulfuromonadales bacterium]
MHHECVNGGGSDSLFYLDEVPALEQPLPLGGSVVTVLEAWQARPGEIITVVDPQQTFYRARLVSIEGEKATVVPFQPMPRAMESPVDIEVYQALPEKERFELVLQKLTEIGVSRIVPYTSARSITLPERDAGQKKSHRWPEVIVRAAKQCRRARLPELFSVLSWDQATYYARQTELKLLLYEGEAPWSLQEILRESRPASVSLLVGPEGGFSPEEVAEVRDLGFLPVSIGPRILRTETAAILGAALVQYAVGDYR